MIHSRDSMVNEKPILYSYKIKITIEFLYERGNDLDKICRILGIPKALLNLWLIKDELFLTSYKEKHKIEF